MKIFIDTNILVYLTIESSIFFESANNRLEEAIANGDDLFISYQVIKEYYCALTQKYKISPKDTLENIQKLVEHITVLHDNDLIMNLWSNLVETHKITGQKSFDANKAATMILNGISHLMTHNGKDFSLFPEIKLITI